MSSLRDLSNSTLRPETLAISHGYDPKGSYGAAKPPSFMSSTFVYPSAKAAKDLHEAFFDGTATGASGYIYGRLGHPNLDMAEQRLAALDGAEDAAIFASGMASINATLLAFLSAGDVILHSRPVYGGTDMLIHNELPRFGIQSAGIFDACDPASVAEATERALAKGRVGVIWFESPANPTASIADISLAVKAAGEIEQRQGSRPVIAVDNTFLGPFVSRPLQHGADLVMTSLTKYAGGHSDLLAGGISGPKALVAKIKALRTLFGSTLDAHSSLAAVALVRDDGPADSKGGGKRSRDCCFFARPPEGAQRDLSGVHCGRHTAARGI